MIFIYTMNRDGFFRKMQYRCQVNWLPVQTACAVGILKFPTLYVCCKGLDKQCRPRSDCFWWCSLISVFPVCYSIKHLWIPTLTRFNIFISIQVHTIQFSIIQTVGWDQSKILLSSPSTFHLKTEKSETRHEISNNVDCVTSKVSYTQSDQ